MQLLLLPGMDGTGLLFEPFLRTLPADWDATVVAYPPDRPLGYSELLPIVESAARKMSDFIVVGESFSGPLALTLAHRKPAGLRGVVLAASFVRCPAPGVLRNACDLVRSWMFRYAPTQVVASALCGSQSNRRLRFLLQRTIRSVAPEVLALRVREIGRVDVRKELRECLAPVLYLQGLRDWVVPSWCGREVKRLHPQATLATLDAAHLVLQLRAAESFAAIRRSVQP